MASKTNPEVTVTVTEVTITTKPAKNKHIRINLDGTTIEIPVTDEIWTYANEQFFTKNTTPLQKKRFATLMNLIRAAYLKGKADAK